MALDQGASEGQLRSIICAWKSIEKKKKKKPQRGKPCAQKSFLFRGELLLSSAAAGT
jgi:hypothetical protein